MDHPITITIAAAFTDQKYAGSPTGVVLDANGLSDEQMQHIANSTNCSHTAFVTESRQDDYDVGVRFFTAGGEIKNCGHGTIALHVVRAVKRGNVADGIVRQRTESGIQEVQVQHENGAITVWLKQDEIRFHPVERETIGDLLSALNLPESSLQPDYPVIIASPGANRFLVALKDVEALQALKPDIAALKKLGEQVKGIGCFVYAMNAPLEATARMFAPNIGVDEDVTNGNSGGCLGAYLLRLDKTNPSELILQVHQGQAFNRPGTVLVKVCRVGDAIETVIGGTAVIESTARFDL